MVEHDVAIKICGLINIEDALICAAAGAEMLGLNFSARSVRCVVPGTGRKIVSAVRAEFPRIKFVGVFLDQKSGEVQKIAADLSLDAVQLHGDETPDYVRELEAAFVIKALRIRESRRDLEGRALSRPSSQETRTTRRSSLHEPDVASVAGALAYQCDAILLDSWDRAAPGGTGRTFPWSIAAGLRPQVRRLILAGGLTNANVREAIRAVQPFAVDVCSGVESAPGRKDKKKVRAFVKAVRAANTTR